MWQFFSRSKDLQTNIEVWNTALKKKSMRINVDKTKVAVVSRERKNINITANVKIIEQVEAVKYLNSVFENQGSLDIEINERVNAATKYMEV